tara:strand:- start:223 stop:588 length:366 start_codon:yes stop_codon:yes gene_type:complete
MKIEGPIWIESKPNEGSLAGTTLYNQFVSYSNKEMDYECPHHAAEVMNVLLTAQDVEMIGDKDPSSLFATIGTAPWSFVPDYLQEALSDLNAFGEDTIVARRHWVLDGDELFPVVIGENEG